MKLRSGCVLDLASYFMCTKGSCFEALINYSSPVLPVGWNNDVALDVFFFLCACFPMPVACSRVSSRVSAPLTCVLGKKVSLLLFSLPHSASPILFISEF